jgi:hypothetical protein
VNVNETMSVARWLLAVIKRVAVALCAWAWPNDRRAFGYCRRHGYSHRTPVGYYACELVYRYRVQHPTAGHFGRYSGVGTPLALPSAG